MGTNNREMFAILVVLLSPAHTERAKLLRADPRPG